MKEERMDAQNKTTFYGFRKAFIKNPEIPLEARFLNILLMTYKGKNESCWPSLGEIGKRMSRNRDTVRKYMKILVKDGFVKVEKRGIGRSHLYTPSYTKVYAGQQKKEVKQAELAEETIHQPDETTLNRSISSGNKVKGFTSGKELFDLTRRRLGL